MAKPSDFVDVQLSAAGAKLAPVRISTAHFSYEFTAGATVRVLTSEWRRVLALESRGGAALLEIAPATPAAAPAPAATPKTGLPQPGVAAEAAPAPATKGK